MQVKVVRDDLQHKREHAKTSLFKRCYSQAFAVKALIYIQPNIARVASRQIFRVNTEPNTPFQYYLRNICYTLLDHLMQGIDNRFDKYRSTIYGLILLVIVEIDKTVKDIKSSMKIMYQCLLTQKNAYFLIEKKMGVLAEKQSSPHHCLDSESLGPWHVSESLCVTKNLYYNSSNFMQMRMVGQCIKVPAYLPESIDRKNGQVLWCCYISTMM